MSNEITVKLKCSIKEFCNIIESKGFEIVDRFLLDDTYFIPKDIDIHKLTSPRQGNEHREILKHSILIRDITQYMSDKHKVFKMTYKKKNIASNGDIISQQNIDCDISNINDGKKFLNAIGYKEIMNIKENNIVYGKEGLNIALKDIEDGEKLIEIETVETNEDLNTVEKLKEKLNELQLPLDTKDYFIKKAEMKLKQISEDGV